MTAKQQDIKRKTPHQHTRIRTEMYLGSRGVHSQETLVHTDLGPFILPVSWVPALMTSIREILDNSLDELTKGKIKNGEIRIIYDPVCMHFTISDNGRGIPIDWDGPEGMTKVQMALTELMAGDNFEDAERKGTAGMNGIGGSTVAHVSEFFNVTVTRAGRPYNDYIDENADYTDEEMDLIEANALRNDYKGKYVYSQSYSEGAFDERGREILQIDDAEITHTKSRTTGTVIEFALSPEVFDKMELPLPLVESLIREIAAVNPQIKLFFNGELIKVKPGIIKTLFPEAKTVIQHTVEEDGFFANFFVMPGLVAEGMMHHGLVNNIPMFEGGTHIQAFKDRFALGLIKALEKESKRRKLKPNRSDVEEGLLMYHVTVMDGPFFNGQAKTKLINDECYKTVEKSMDDAFFDAMIRKHKEWIDDIYTRTSQRTNKKDMDEATREAKKNLRKKVAKLEDAHFAGKAIKKRDTILFLTEGDSANNMSEVKNNNIHGTLPLRGKILNVMDPKVGIPELLGLKKKGAKAGAKDAKPSASSTADIMNALGLVPGEKADRSKLRYGSLCIATDMDPDGANIAALIVNFLYKWWPELFDDTENPFVYVFMTPFIILTKGKQREYFFLNDYEEFDTDDWKGWNIRRAKGLGTLQKIDWKNSFDNLRVIPVVNDESLAGTLDLLFNKDRADARKEWMMGSVKYQEWLDDQA